MLKNHLYFHSYFHTFFVVIATSFVVVASSVFGVIIFTIGIFVSCVICIVSTSIVVIIATATIIVTSPVIIINYRFFVTRPVSVNTQRWEKNCLMIHIVFLMFILFQILFYEVHFRFGLKFVLYDISYNQSPIV